MSTQNDQTAGYPCGHKRPLVGTRGVVHGRVAEAVNVMLGDLAFP